MSCIGLIVCGLGYDGETEYSDWNAVLDGTRSDSGEC